ncbi:Myb/SANT-like domain-containing protein, partial [Cynara cardunculus var. scolymus]
FQSAADFNRRHISKSSLWTESLPFTKVSPLLHSPLDSNRHISRSDLPSPFSIIDLPSPFQMADRRNWSIQEEDVLISILQEIVAAGGRSDNGCFRTDTYEQIILKMSEKILGLNITSKHIQNKMKRLKDKYSATYDILNTSGFSWNDAHQCVTVDAQVLEEYIKKHPSKNYIANKPFPQYERLKTIFGKD